MNSTTKVVTIGDKGVGYTAGVQNYKLANNNRQKDLCTFFCKGQGEGHQSKGSCEGQTIVMYILNCQLPLSAISSTTGGSSPSEHE